MTDESGSQVALSAIQGLFAANGGLARFVLPDGELGRLGGNLYRLTFAVARSRKLLLELDDQLLLVLTEPDVLAASRRQVRIRSDQMTFDWQEYSNFLPHATTYPAGQIDFLGQG